MDIDALTWDDVASGLGFPKQKSPATPKQDAWLQQIGIIPPENKQSGGLLIQYLLRTRGSDIQNFIDRVHHVRKLQKQWLGVRVQNTDTPDHYGTGRVICIRPKNNSRFEGLVVWEKRDSHYHLLVTLSIIQ